MIDSVSDPCRLYHADHQKEGLEQNIQEAAKWYRRAASKGDSTAQYTLQVIQPELDELEEAEMNRRRAEVMEKNRRSSHIGSS